MVAAITLAALMFVFDENTAGSLRLTPISLLLHEAGANESGSVVKPNAVRSPGWQLALMSPPGGAQSWMPSLSTTSGAATISHARLVGIGPSVLSTIAGPSASKPPIAGRF